MPIDASISFFAASFAFGNISSTLLSYLAPINEFNSFLKCCVSLAPPIIIPLFILGSIPTFKSCVVSFWINSRAGLLSTVNSTFSTSALLPVPSSILATGNDNSSIVFLGVSASCRYFLTSFSLFATF